MVRLFGCRYRLSPDQSPSPPIGGSTIAQKMIPYSEGYSLATTSDHLRPPPTISDAHRRPPTTSDHLRYPLTTPMPTTRLDAHHSTRCLPLDSMPTTRLDAHHSTPTTDQSDAHLLRCPLLLGYSVTTRSTRCHFDRLTPRQSGYMNSNETIGYECMRGQTSKSR